MAAETKFLNLDDLSDQPEITVQFKNERHVFKRMTVRDFTTVQSQFKDTFKEGATEEQQAAGMVEMIHRAFPTMSKEDIWEMQFDRMFKLMDFIKSVSEEGAPEGVSGK